MMELFALHSRLTDKTRPRLAVTTQFWRRGRILLYSKLQ